MGVAKRIRKLIAGPRESSDYPRVAGITYVHHRPTTPNLGDDLCSPRRYFELETDLADLVVLGGGVFVGLGLRKLRELGLRPQRTVVWAVGRSSKRGAHDARLPEDLPFLAWATRDRAAAPTEAHYLPCVSCLHPMLDTPTEGDGVLVFLNADREVTPARSLAHCRAVAEQRGWRLLLNSCRVDELRDALRQSRRIVTNSYHGAYWGLLSGRGVSLAGYSTKFSSLFSSFELPAERVVPVAKGDATRLASFVEKAGDAADALWLPDAGAKLADARRRNRDFAARLEERGILRTVRPRTPA